MYLQNTTTETSLEGHMRKNLNIVCTQDCTLFDQRKGQVERIKYGQKFVLTPVSDFDWNDLYNCELLGLFSPLLLEDSKFYFKFLVSRDIFKDCFAIIED